MQNKAIIYIRVSTEDQKSSLAVQQLSLEEYCKFKGFDIVEKIVDEDISGGKPFYERPGGFLAQKLFKEGIKTIITLKVDRIFRNVKDALITTDDWDRAGISLNIADMGGNSIDTKSALGRMMFIQIVSMGEFERKLAGERTKSVLNHKKEQRTIYCGEVFGYDKQGQKLVGKKWVGGELVVNEREQLIVGQIFELKKQNLNNSRIATILNERGIKTKMDKTFKSSTIQAILSNPIHLDYKCHQ
jgi:DNA invertase Pin-like site-specific DNA recombinase